MYFSFEVVRQTHSSSGLNLCKLVLPCLLTEADLLHVSFLSASTSLVVVAVVVPTLVVVIVLVVLLMVFVLWMKFKRQGN